MFFIFTSWFNLTIFQMGSNQQLVKHGHFVMGYVISEATGGMTHGTCQLLEVAAVVHISKVNTIQHAFLWGLVFIIQHKGTYIDSFNSNNIFMTPRDMYIYIHILYIIPQLHNINPELFLSNFILLRSYLPFRICFPSRINRHNISPHIMPPARIEKNPRSGLMPWDSTPQVWEATFGMVFWWQILLVPASNGYSFFLKGTLLTFIFHHIPLWQCFGRTLYIYI